VVRVATKGTIDTNVVTFEVKVEVGGSDQRLLKPEMTANVVIVAAEKENMPIVPVAAIERRGKEHFVTVEKESGITEERAVKTGISDGEFMEILSGLSEGERVVVSSDAVRGRWGKEEKEDKKDGNGDKKGGNNTRRDVMRMRIMGGGRRR
jgi:multidrug efflux pump subunit AcrA (membrane-fusion protein)